MKDLRLVLSLIATFTFFSIVSLSSNDETVNIKSLDNKYTQAHSSSSVLVNSRVFRVSFSNLNFNHKTFSENYFKTNYFQIILNDYFFKVKFKIFNNYIKNCLINYRKSDLIFPFHYYW